MTGTPNNGVTALRGMTPFSPGNVHIRLHNKATAPPINNERGINNR